MDAHKYNGKSVLLSVLTRIGHAIDDGVESSCVNLCLNVRFVINLVPNILLRPKLYLRRSGIGAFVPFANNCVVVLPLELYEWITVQHLTVSKSDHSDRSNVILLAVDEQLVIRSLELQHLRQQVRYFEF